MKCFTLSILLSSTILLADNSKVPTYECWMTGPLICPSYSLVPKGSYNIEPYIYVTSNYGNYGSNWSVESQPNLIKAYNYTLIQVGVTDNFNVSISPQFYYQEQGGFTTANIGDIPLELYFPILTENTSGAMPGLLIGVKANVPCGSYKRLSPDAPSAKIIGSGSWEPGVSLVIGKQIHLNKSHFLTVRSGFNVLFRNKISVEGFHAYGGGYGSKGKVALGTQYTAVGSFEYSFNQHVVFAFDAVYQHNNKITFSGQSGFQDQGKTIPATNGAPSSEQISLAPALEYNFNANVGVIGGVWFSVAGRNAGAFYTPTFALNIEY